MGTHHHYRMALIALALGFATHAHAVGTSNKLLATGGVSTIEGAAGGGLAPWALIAGYGTDEQIGGSVFYTGVNLDDYDFRGYGAAIGFYDRVELSIARQDFNTRNVLVPVSAALRNHKLKQDIFGIKVRLFGDAIYDQDTWVPQVAVGLQYKDNKDETVIPFLNGALGGGIKNSGTDFYVAATKLYLRQSLLLNGVVRFSKANQYGLLGFEGPDGDSYEAGLEGSAALLLRKDFAVGFEFRTKNGNLKNPSLNLKEETAYDVFAAWFPNKNLSVTAAYVDLGQIVGALTNNDSQRGGYLSLQVGF
jgi:hypothetical protein